MTKEPTENILTATICGDLPKSATVWYEFLKITDICKLYIEDCLINIDGYETPAMTTTANIW